MPLVLPLYNSESLVIRFYPSDTSDAVKATILAENSGCAFATNAIEMPEPNEDFSNLLMPHHVSITDGVAAILTGADKDAAEVAEDARFELNELRKERNKRIAETDWWANSDLTMTAEQTAYRQALRDITDTYTSLDDVGWPTKP